MLRPYVVDHRRSRCRTSSVIDDPHSGRRSVLWRLAWWGAPGASHPHVLLLEHEIGQVLGAVAELEVELAAAAGPALVGLPGVAVLPRRRIVAQAAGARCHRLLDLVGLRAAAGDLLNLGVAAGEDVQPVVAAQAEFHRDGAAGLGAVNGRQVVYGLEEAAPAIGNLVGHAGTGGVARVISGSTG